MYVLHFAPLDPTGYPPLINTVHVSAELGFETVVVASTPLRHQGVLGNAAIISSTEHLTRLATQRFFAQAARSLIHRRGRPALIIGHDLLGLPAAAMTARAAGVPFVYHCHDFHGPRLPVSKLFDIGETLFGKQAAEVWVPMPERASEAHRRGIGKHTQVVRNCPRTVEKLPAKGRLRSWLSEHRSRTRGTGKLITRHGGIGPAHCLIPIIESLPRLADDVEFVVIGRDPHHYGEICMRRARELGVADRVFFHPVVPHSELFELVVDGDAASGLYAPDDVNTSTPAPNKVYENLALGIPVVVRAGGALAVDIVSTGSGVAITNDSVETVCAALNALLFDAGGHHFGQCARAAHLNAFNYELQLAPTILCRGRPTSARLSDARQPRA
jgi:glycosyltransferase involved in cell wall biosynthesis